MVDVVDEGVERAHPLLQTRFQRAPLGLRNDARNDVEGDQPLGVAALAVDRKGDADAVEYRIRLGALGRQHLGRLGVEPGLVRPAMQTRRMVRIQHFIIGFGGRRLGRYGGIKLGG